MKPSPPIFPLSTLLQHSLCMLLSIKSKTMKKSLLLLLCCYAYAANAQIGLDWMFGNMGIVHDTINTSKLWLFPNGKILSFGHTYNGNQLSVAKYLDNGDRDLTFGQGGLYQTDAAVPFGSGAVAGAVQSDGRIVVLGYWQGSSAKICRLLANGSKIDSSYGVNGYVSNTFTPRQILLQPDDKALTAAPLNHAVLVQRLTTAGMPDSSFGLNSIAVINDGSPQANVPNPLTQVTGIGLMPDGRMVVGANGYDSVAAAPAYVSMAIRLLPDGRPDSSFGGDGRVFVAAANNALGGDCMSLQPDGKVLLGGVPWTASRFNMDGSMDTGFNHTGQINLGFEPTQMAVQADGRILIGGRCGAIVSFTDFCIARLGPDGRIDSSFGTNGFFVMDYMNGMNIMSSMVLQPDDKILFTDENSPEIFRLTPYPLSVEMVHAGLQRTKVHPNPASAFIQVENEDQSNQPATVWLYDLLGRVQEVHTLQQQLSISTESLSTGNYIIKVTHADGLTDTHCITVRH